MYGGSFKQHYGWHIQQELYKLGIDKYQIRELSVLEDACDPATYDSLKRLSVLQEKTYADSSDTDINEAKGLKKQIDQTVENSVRTQLGLVKRFSMKSYVRYLGAWCPKEKDLFRTEYQSDLH